MDFLRKYLNKKSQRVLFMVLLSIIVWSVLKFQRQYETNIEVPLKIIGIPQDSTLKYNIHDKIKTKADGNYKLSKSSDEIKKLLEKVPELCTKSYYKRVPSIILKSQRESQVAYLQGYFDTDGSCSKNRNYKVSLTSVSKLGLLEIQQMLLNLGIISRIAKRKTSHYHNGIFIRGETNRLTISSLEGQRFFNLVGFGLPSKQRNFNNYKGDYHKENINCLPFEFYSDLRELNKYLPYSTKHARYPIGRWLRRNTKIKVHLLKEILENHKELSHLYCYKKLLGCTDDLFFDKVKSIERFKDHAWDIEVSSTHSYISNGFISHNTLIAAMLYKTFVGARALILVNNTDLYKQFLDDMPKMFGDDWGYMQGKKIKWADIMVCMTPTLRNNLKRYESKLGRYNMVLFDECHLITSKTNEAVMTALYNTNIRVGLSGTPLAHKDPTKNMRVRAFFGEVVYTIKNIELIEMGFSTPLIIKIVKGNTSIKIKGDYDEEYRRGITNSLERTKASLDRIDFYLRRGLCPILVVGKYHRHVENLYNHIQERFGKKYRVRYIHGGIKNRKKILDKFKRGKIDILVSSLIIKLGQNMPLIRYMQNAAGGDSQINALQLIGRILRKHESKEKVYYEDLYDEGFYLKRHSKHRILWYKKEGFKVIELWKR